MSEDQIDAPKANRRAFLKKAARGTATLAATSVVVAAASKPAAAGQAYGGGSYQPRPSTKHGRGGRGFKKAVISRKKFQSYKRH